MEILLPQVKGKDRDGVAKKSIEETKGEVTQRIRVLIAEDDPALRRLIEATLAPNYEVFLAADGEEALRVFLEDPEKFDILLTDMVMPGMGGRKLADQVRQRRANIQLIYMTGYSASEIAEHGVVEPKITVLAKPFTPNELRKVLRHAADEKSAAAGVG